MLIYITGGSRSGKSRHAVELARKMARRVTFVATCLPSEDKELKQRIKHHRSERPRHWDTLENLTDLSEVFSKSDRRTELFLIDCLTMYVSGRLMEGESEPQIYKRITTLCKAAAASSATTILVSNEVGCGLVPMTDLGRKFRDYAGRANQIAAKYADEVILMVSGIPLQLKGASNER